MDTTTNSNTLSFLAGAPSTINDANTDFNDVVWVKDSSDDAASLRIKESDLSGSISNPTKSQEAIQKATEEGEKGEDKEEKLKASDDFQLYEALLLLKGLNILSKS